jgi:hypothetical protein
MATIDLHATGTLKVTAYRTEDEAGEVTLVITTDEGKIRIHCGTEEEDADRVYDALNKGAAQARAVSREWEYRPHEYDAYVSIDHSMRLRGTRYRIMLEGVTPPGTPADGYPDKAVAIYELAAAMAMAGSFPAAWLEGADWAPQSIDDEVRKFHDAGGDKLLPLAGVQYEPGTEVRSDDGTWEVIRDYGVLGVWMGVPGDWSCGERFADHDDVLPAELLSAARGWAADCEWIEDAEDIADITDEQVIAGIAAHYDGGWAQFARDRS